MLYFSIESLAFVMEGKEESLHTGCHIRVTALLQGCSVTCRMKAHGRFSSTFLNHTPWKTAEVFAACRVAF